MEIEELNTGKCHNLNLSETEIKLISKNFLESPEELFDFINASIEKFN